MRMESTSMTRSRSSSLDINRQQVNLVVYIYILLGGKYIIRKYVMQSRADTTGWVAGGNDIRGAMCIVIWRGRYLASGNKY